MDLVVPLSQYSLDSKDEELRYMLRSARENVPDLGVVFLVGHRPSWLKCDPQVEHVAFEDSHATSKDANIIRKILFCCRNCENGSGEFLVNSDDQIFCRPVRRSDLNAVWLASPRVFSDASLAGDKSFWHVRLLDTIMECRRNGWPELAFEVHLPYVVNTESYVKIMESIDYYSGNGLLTHIYFNAFLNEPGCDLADPVRPPEHWFIRFKWSKDLPFEDAQEALKSKVFLNYDDASYTAGLRQALQERFPVPAPWERYESA